MIHVWYMFYTYSCIFWKEHVRVWYILLVLKIFVLYIYYISFVFNELLKPPDASIQSGQHYEEAASITKRAQYRMYHRKANSRHMYSIYIYTLIHIFCECIYLFLLSIVHTNINIYIYRERERDFVFCIFDMFLMHCNTFAIHV